MQGHACSFPPISCSVLCHFFLSIIETSSSNRVKVSKGIKLIKMTEKKKLILNSGEEPSATRHFPAASIHAFPCSHSAQCTLNFCWNIWKKRDAHFLPLKQKYSIHTTMWWWHQILEEFFIQSYVCPLRTSTHSSPTVGQWIVPCVTVEPVPQPSFPPLNLTRFHLPTRMPNACV